ncbi:hypothetical protein Scani_49470 [Streptomyces caniferus]|uniref:Uncharacterized protein n=1 Tax=Streptomyces caniferus TaxID=285557 RepID=A0A640SBK0_9ACTN|nr:hypothetical protein Scani_49470 [Streptomyces caniferus]
MSTIHNSWAGEGCRPLAAILGIARFIAATSDCATSTQAHIAAVTERCRAGAPTDAGEDSGGETVEVMAGTLESWRVDLKCKVCTP